MRVFQVAAADGSMSLGLLEGSRALVLGKRHEGVMTALDLFQAVDDGALDAASWRRRAGEAGAFEERAWTDVKPPLGLCVPLAPPEVWGAGVTYRQSADFREEGTGIYDRIYNADRPELFFKASAWRCAGPGQPIGRRRDSTFTASEAELAVVLGSTGAVLGFALANDVSAWDIERENPLYLPQSKIYRGCFALGPVIVTPDEIPDPYALELRCVIKRGEEEVFSGSACTRQLKRGLPELIDWLLRSNEIRTGTVLSTGTGIIQPREVGLEEGDIVSITCPEIGELVNPVRFV